MLCTTGMRKVMSNSAPADGANGKTLSQTKFKELCCAKKPETCSDFAVTWGLAQATGAGCAAQNKFFDLKKANVGISAAKCSAHSCSSGMVKISAAASTECSSDAASCTDAKCCKSGAGDVAVAAKVVKFSLTYTSLDFTKLTNAQKVSIRSAIVSAVAASMLPAVYGAGSIVTTLKAGSVVADVQVTPLAGTKATDVIASLTPAKRTTMRKDASAAIAKTADIDQAFATGKTSDDLITDGTVSTPIAVAGEAEGTDTTSSVDCAASSAMFSIFAIAMAQIVSL